jgi:hypothetical protein
MPSPNSSSTPNSGSKYIIQTHYDSNIKELVFIEAKELTVHRQKNQIHNAKASNEHENTNL